ncbi:hypothetical protein LTR17_011316 [Elasticomyces elasticus]|nr:hypothetical protein LTR17_011316 [Elasticomyces elasticus]
MAKHRSTKIPSAYEDVIEPSLAVINDNELLVDGSRVILCGASAGGNLVLAAAQDVPLRDKVAGVAAIYPATLYLDEDADKTDVLISPAYITAREDLPPEILLIGAEHDVFCREDEVMADKVANFSDGDKERMDAGSQAKGVQWHKVVGQPHGFDAFPAKDPGKEEARIMATENMYKVITDWILRNFPSRSLEP